MMRAVIITTRVLRNTPADPIAWRSRVVASQDSNMFGGYPTHRHRTGPHASAAAAADAAAKWCAANGFEVVASPNDL